MKSIKTRIIILVGILLLCVCAGFGVIAYTTSSNALILNIEETMPKFAVEASKTIHSEIMNHLVTLEAIAANDKITEYLTKNKNNLSDIQSLMKNEMERKGHLEMALADITGQAVFSGGAVTDLKENDYFKKAIAGQTNISDPIENHTDHSINMAYAVPIQSDGKIIGALIAYRDGYELSDMAKHISYGKSGQAFIISNQGRTIAHADKQLISSIVVKEDEPATGDTDANSSASYTVDATSSATVSDAGIKVPTGFENFADLQGMMIEGKTGFGEYKYTGVQKFLGYAPVPDFNWSVGVEVNKDEMLSGLKSLQFNFSLLTAVFLIISLLVAFLITINIKKPIAYITKECHRMADGDLTGVLQQRYIKRRDEIGELTRAFQTISQSLREVISEAAGASVQVASSSQELTASIQHSSTTSSEVSKAIEEIARGAGEQAGEAGKGAQTVAQMGTLIEQTREYIVSLSQSARQVELLKEEGFEILKSLVKKTGDSGRATEEIYQVIINTNESAEKIQQVSQQIEGIAEQTNMLALNAAIEAARAGETGKGFAVVAEEVRKLAEESNAFTKAITMIIRELLEKTEGAVDTMKQVSSLIASQSESVQMTENRFEKIAEAIENTKRMIDSLNQFGLEMSDKKNEVINVILNLSAVSQESAAATEEVAASIGEQTAAIGEIAETSEVLAGLAETMNQTISKFKY